MAAGGIALVWRLLGIAGADGDPFDRDVEFVGCNLCHGGEHALSQLDPPGEHGHLARRRESDPSLEAWIVVERPGQGSVHCPAPASMTAAAFSTARMMRLCEPQRQMLPSSACAIS